MTCFLVINDGSDVGGGRVYLTALQQQLLLLLLLRDAHLECCDRRGRESASEPINSTHKMYVVALIFLLMSAVAASDCPHGKFIDINNTQASPEMPNFVQSLSA